MSDFLRFGDAPRPATSQEMERDVRETILRELSADPGATVRGTEHLSVRAQIEGARIVAFALDASGVEIDVAGDDSAGTAAQQGPDGGEETAAVEHREVGLLQEGSFIAVPLRFQGVPVDIEAGATNVPFEWLTLDDGGLALALPHEMTTEARRGASFHLRVVVSPDDILAAIMKVMRAELAEGDGIHVEREKLALRQLGPRHLRISISARLRWKFLRPTLRARADLHIDNHFVARLKGTRITSSNIVLGVVLRIYRSRITRELRTPVDLQAALTPLALRSLRIHAGGSRLRVEVEAGLA